MAPEDRVEVTLVPSADVATRVAPGTPPGTASTGVNVLAQPNAAGPPTPAGARPAHKIRAPVPVSTSVGLMTATLHDPTSPVYLDAASAMPLHPVARETLLAALEDGWADPARLYAAGRRARLLLDGAREAVASELGARADEVSFTSSGTVAAHQAVLGALAGRRRAGRLLVHSAVEHSCVLQAGQSHVAAGGEQASIGVDALGSVDVDALRALLDTRPDTALVSVQSANHEVGTCQPLDAVHHACAGVPLHVDAAQSLAWEAPAPGWSLLTGSARKWGGPAGVGVLAVRTGTRWRSPMPSDEAEGGRMPGALNLPLVLAAATSLQAARAESAALAPRLRALVERIRTEVPRLVPDVEVLGHPSLRLPHLVTFSALYVEGEAAVRALDAAGFAVTSGSSCTSSTLTPSHVLEAMGALTHGNLRVSLHRGSTEADVDRLLAVLPGVLTRLRADAGAAGL